MRIGLDFDNTIVSYDALFHAVALEQGHIPVNIAENKNAVRDYLREVNQEEIWTKMQGYVYGARMQEAQAHPDAVAVISALKQAGHQLFIISHKTRHPYQGPAYDLHSAARAWICSHLLEDDTPLFNEEDVYFHERKEEKIQRISTLSCDVFLDDLPEILLHDAFPHNVKKYLFSATSTTSPDFEVVEGWRAFEKAIAA